MMNPDYKFDFNFIDSFHGASFASLKEKDYFSNPKDGMNQRMEFLSENSIQKELSATNNITNTNKISIEENGNNSFADEDYTPEEKIPNCQSKELIFNITKEKRSRIRIGRMNKLLKKRYFGKHNKFSEDNIIRKIKTSFMDKSLDYINREYAIYMMNKHEKKKNRKLLQRIKPKEYLKIKKSENFKWFKSTLKKVFSVYLSKKCTLYSVDHNIRQIEKLYEENEAINVINILNKRVTDLYYEYCNDINIEGFQTLKYDLKHLRQKMEEGKEENIDLYLNRYKDIAKNLESIFEHKKGRRNYGKRNKSGYM